MKMTKVEWAAGIVFLVIIYLFGVYVVAPLKNEIMRTSAKSSGDRGGK